MVDLKTDESNEKTETRSGADFENSENNSMKDCKSLSCDSDEFPISDESTFITKAEDIELKDSTGEVDVKTCAKLKDNDPDSVTSLEGSSIYEESIGFIHENNEQANKTGDKMSL